ncbi:MAG TPA: dTDP-4-dehydrorhamnose reductase, partial [Candidatus Kerfeldbacteria bacterium]|nr:dTDP-4-dehydrorhamnose reductase [Candidatus Kerfeldbacteria bacterium]
TALRQTLTDYTVLTPHHSEVDITQRAAVIEYIGKHRPTCIVNAAAYTQVDDCEANRAVALQVNGEAPAYMAEAASLVGSRLVQYSTDYVFSGTKAVGYAETDQPDQPVNAYGESKLAGELAIQSWLADQAYIIRTAWLYGAGGKNFVDTMLQLGQDQSEVKVVNDQHGSPTYVQDLAVATSQLLQDQPSSGIYHLTNAGHCTWHDFAVEIFKQAHLPAHVQPCTSAEFPRPAKRPAYSILLNTKRPLLRSWQAGLTAYMTSSRGQR